MSRRSARQICAVTWKCAFISFVVYIFHSSALMQLIHVAPTWDVLPNQSKAVKPLFLWCDLKLLSDCCDHVIWLWCPVALWDAVCEVREFVTAEENHHNIISPRIYMYIYIFQNVMKCHLFKDNDQRIYKHLILKWP